MHPSADIRVSSNTSAGERQISSSWLASSHSRVTLSSSNLLVIVPDSHLRFRVLFQWFLTALSVRPGSSFAMEAHLLP